MSSINQRYNIKVTHYAILSVLVVLTCIASSPLSLDRWFVGSDSSIHLIRLNDVCYEMSIGNYYPRWLSQASYGKGLPTLNFYSPAFYVMVGYLNAVGFPIITAMAIICASSFFLGAWGMFLWTKKYCGEIGALIAASIYMFAPYHLADIYLRSALPEFIALALLPFLFYSIDLSLSPDRSFRGFVYCAISSAAIVLTHNLTALMISPFALIYFIWCYYYSQSTPKNILFAGLGFLLGAGLSSFYWIPVLCESKYLLNLNAIVGSSLYYVNNFNRLLGFFSADRNGLYTYSTLYALLFICSGLSFSALLFNKSIKIKFGIITIVFCIISIVMTFSISLPIYKLVPPLQYIQFPWRFLGPATLFVSAFCGLIPSSRLVGENTRVALIVCGSIVISCIFLSDGLRNVKGPAPDFPAKPVAFSTKSSYPIFNSTADPDFMPIDSRFSRGDFIEFPWLYNDKMERPLTSCRKIGSHLTCRVAVTQITDLEAPWLYFPGWKATCDNIPQPVYPSKMGLVTLAIPQGEHDIEIWFGTTLPRIIGWILAVASLAVLSCSIVVRIYRTK